MTAHLITKLSWHHRTTRPSPIFYSLSLSLVVTVVGEVHSDWGWGLTGGPLDYTQYFSDSVPSQLLHEPLSSLVKSAPYSSVDMVARRPQRPHMTFSIRMRGVGQPRHTKSHAACAGHSE